MRLRTWFTLLIIVATATVTAGHSYSGHKWNVRQVPYYVNPVSSDVSEEAALAAIQYAASAWSMQSNADFSFYYMGRTNSTTLSNNGKNEVFFRSTSPGGNIAETYRYWNSAGTLVDTDIVFYDGTYNFFTNYVGCSGGYYIEEIATHEFGHALGLNHSDVTTATMVAGAYSCANWKGSLDPDDVAGVEALYPPSSSSTNAPPSVTVNSPSSGASFVQGTAVSFTGSATDPEDGNLSAHLRWTSNIDGPLGSGASLSRSLSAGTHTITADVSDSSGASASRTVSVSVSAPANATPSLTISSPSNNVSVVQGASVSFSGSASDSEDGNLTSRITWTSNLDGQIGVGGAVSRVLSAGTHTVSARVVDNAGASATRSVTVNVMVPVNAVPTVSIASPKAGSSVGEGTTVTFSGSATDPEDGTLSSRLTWNSSVDGPLGIGSSVSRALSAGSHTVTAEVADSAGALGSRTVTFTVTIAAPTPTPTPSSIVASASVTKTKGKQNVSLRWTGATGATVAIYRDGVLRSTTSNSGSFTDVLQGRGAYNYMVCEAGTSVCSNTVPVRF
jgi:hypothetical protein